MLEYISVSKIHPKYDRKSDIMIIKVLSLLWRSADQQPTHDCHSNYLQCHSLSIIIDPNTLVKKIYRYYGAQGAQLHLQKLPKGVVYRNQYIFGLSAEVRGSHKRIHGSCGLALISSPGHTYGLKCALYWKWSCDNPFT